MERNEFYENQNKLLSIIEKELVNYVDWDKLEERLSKELKGIEDVSFLWNTTRKYKNPVIPAWKKAKKN